MRKVMTTVKIVQVYGNAVSGDLLKRERPRPPIIWPPPRVKAPLVRIATNVR